MKFAQWIAGVCLLALLTGCDKHPVSHYQGYVEGENTYLASPYSGTLNELAVVRGEQVKKGQRLFVLDPYPQILQLQQYDSDWQQAKDLLEDLKKPRRSQEIDAIKAQIAQVESQIHLTQLRVQRYQTLFQKKVVQRDRLDEVIASAQEQLKLKAQYEANLQLAELGSRMDQIRAQSSQVLSLDARKKQIQWQLSQKTQVAPAEGVVFDTYYRPGEFVKTQQAVLSMLIPSDIYIEFFVPVEALAHLSVGQSLSVICMGCTTSEKAVTHYISPEAQYVPPLIYSRENHDKLVFRIKARLSKKTALKPGQPVTVSVPAV